MASFDSPLGKKSFSNQQPTREFIVDDASDGGHQEHSNQNQSYNINMDSIRGLQAQPMPSEEDQIEMEKSMQRARAEKRAGKQRLDPGAKKRLEILLGMTKTEREVEIAPETTVVIQTLGSQQLNEVLMISRREATQLEFDFQMRRHALARAVKMVAGNKLEDFIGSKEIDDKLYFIDELDDFVLTKLYKEYGKLSEDAQRKYGLQTEQQQKEVSEEIKK